MPITRTHNSQPDRLGNLATTALDRLGKLPQPIKHFHVWGSPVYERFRESLSVSLPKTYCDRRVRFFCHQHFPSNSPSWWFSCKMQI